MRPIPLEALLAIYAFALVVSYGKWRWALKGTNWTNGEKRIAAALITAIFLGLAALDAFYNHKLAM